MYTNSSEEVRLLKWLWTSEPTICPKCGVAELEYLHKKAKKSDCDWKCLACGEIYYVGKLLSYAETLAAENGFKNIYISTNHDGLYEKCGRKIYCRK